MPVGSGGKVGFGHLVNGKKKKMELHLKNAYLFLCVCRYIYVKAAVAANQQSSDYFWQVHP